jgi:Cu-Zn family superoxide dismutase
LLRHNSESSGWSPGSELATRLEEIGMNMRLSASRVIIAIVALASLMGSAAHVSTAQEATPASSAQMATPMATPVAALDVPLIDMTGAAVGLATFSEGSDGVTLTVLIEGLAPGEHGWHLHEMGICEPGGVEPFGSAGGHWNPTAMSHGGPDDERHHAGDFGNLTASENGLAEVEITTTDFSLGDGPASVYDEDGTAIIIHEGMDDLTTQPDGDSGMRYACGIVAEPMTMPAATPVGIATPMV